MLPQLICNSLVTASILVLIGLGLLFTYRISQFFNFAQGAYFTVGAYLVFLFREGLGVSFPLSVIAGLAVAGSLGILVHTGIYRPLIRRGAPPLILLLVSLAAYVLLTNVVSMAFGDHARSIRPGGVQEGYHLWGARVTGTQLAAICISTCLAVGAGMFMKKTRLGSAFLALANDKVLAETSGVHTEQIMLATFGVAALLAASGGILFALDVGVTPGMGMGLLMSSIVAVIVGGTDSIWGVVLGALLVALAQSFGTHVIGSQWQESLAFIILLAFLLVRPLGVSGRQDWRARV